MKYADLIVTTFVRAVAINEGARAGGSTAPANVSIGVVNFSQTTSPFSRRSERRAWGSRAVFCVR